MEIFKKYSTRKEFKAIVEEILLTVHECGFCQLFSCKWHKELVITCSQCQNIRCLGVGN